jgi:hypothetical protein
MKKFEKVEIIDWYDKIIKAFAFVEEKIYYCSLLTNNISTETKIYICISLEFFKKENEIKKIIQSNDIKDEWNNFYNSLNDIYQSNESFLIKTNDLTKDNSEIVKYKDNFDWNINILFSDYPESIIKAQYIDTWTDYFI